MTVNFINGEAGIGWRRIWRGAWGAFVLLAAACAFRVACGGDAGDSGFARKPGPDAGTSANPRDDAAAIAYVFVIAMENQDADRIYGNFNDAPYINGTLMPRYAHATAFRDALPFLPSEPHYVWMEAGTNVFADHTFVSNHDPSAHNSTADRNHLVAQIGATNGALDWMSYQEGISAATGRCPIESGGFYRPRHNPFVFFKDVAGDPPSRDNPGCAVHHRDLSALAADLASGGVAAYNFITPNLCHNMHGNDGCKYPSRIRGGDDWLAATVPALIDFVDANGGVIFITWEEGVNSVLLPFLAIGPDVKPGHAGAVAYTHSSLLRTVEAILGLPILATVADANDLSDLFLP
jgi:hypothetical protein